MAECYYRLKDYGKADSIVRNLLERSEEWMAWYQSQEFDGKPASQYQRNSWLRTMQHALVTANNYERTQLVEQYIKNYEDNN